MHGQPLFLWNSGCLHFAVVGSNQVFCKALVGVPLKDSEFLKLEQTHLADIIAEEEGNEHFRAGVCLALSAILMYTSRSVLY